MPRPRHNTPVPLERSAPDSFKRMLGRWPVFTVRTLRVEEIRASNLDCAPVRKEQFMHDQVVFFDSYFMDYEVTVPALRCWYINSISPHADVYELMDSIMKGPEES